MCRYAGGHNCRHHYVVMPSCHYVTSVKQARAFWRINLILLLIRVSDSLCRRQNQPPV